MVKKTLIFLLLTSAAYGAAANMYVTSDGAGTKDGSAWANAMGHDEFAVDANENAEAGDIYWLMNDGNAYVVGDMNELNSALDGTLTNPIQIIGVKTGTANEPPDSGNYAYGSDRPTITCGAHLFTTDDYWAYKNLIITTSAVSGVRIDVGGLIENCKITGVTDGKPAVYAGGSGFQIINCELVGANGAEAAEVTNAYSKIINCYLHNDANTGGTGILTTNDAAFVVTGCVLYKWGTGIDLTACPNPFIGNNTFKDCGTAITATTAYAGVFVNNIFDGSGVEAVWDTEEFSNFWDYNIWDASPTRTNVTAGSHGLDADPDMGTPPDFTVSSTSNALDAGMQLSSNHGVTGDYKQNIGVDQDDNGASSGGRSAGANLNGVLQE